MSGTAIKQCQDLCGQKHLTENEAKEFRSNLLEFSRILIEIEASQSTR